MQNLSTLIYRSKNLLQSSIDIQDDTCEINDVSDDTYPFEYFMQIPNRMKRHKFFEDVNVGDIVYGSVARIFPSKLELFLLCTGGTMVRDVYNLKIPAICSSNELPISSNFSTVQSFRRGDLVKCVIVRVERNETVEVSMNTDNSSNKLKHLDLGLCANDNLPKYHKIIRDSNNPPSNFYDIYSKNTLSNSLEIKDKLKFYNLKTTNLSLLDVVNKIEVKSEETAKNLRNSLLMKESKKYVVKGVEYFKQSKYSEALQCYNHALSINESNVDALVARGALRATLKAFELSITDLEKAVKLEPNHKNAGAYLSKAIIAYSKSLPKTEIEKAEKLVKKQLLLEKNMKETSINDISNPNNFIVISDDELLNCSKSTNHKSKEQKKKKHKKQKKSKDSDSHDSRSCTSSPKLKHRKSKHSLHQSKKMKKRTSSSPQSDNHRDNKSIHIDLSNFRSIDLNKSKTDSHRKRKHSSSYESVGRNSSMKIIKNQRSFIDYNHKSKTLHDFKSWYSYDDVTNDHKMFHCNKSYSNQHSFTDSNNRYCVSLKLNDDGVSEKSSIHKSEYISDKNYNNYRETKIIHSNYTNNSISKHQSNFVKKEFCEIVKPDFNESREMDDIRIEDNQKLKAADEQIKLIEDFISQLKNNKKPF